jgi:GTPase SAR1 family protein
MRQIIQSCVYLALDELTNPRIRLGTEKCLLELFSEKNKRTLKHKLTPEPKQASQFTMTAATEHHNIDRGRH